MTRFLLPLLVCCFALVNSTQTVSENASIVFPGTARIEQSLALNFGVTYAVYALSHRDELCYQTKPCDMKGQNINYLRLSKSYYHIKVNSDDVYRDVNLAYQQDSNHANNNSSP